MQDFKILENLQNKVLEAEKGGGSDRINKQHEKGEL